MADDTSSNGGPDGPGGPDVFVATYHDTADRHLARAHIALRRRLRNGTGLWEAEIGGEVLSAPGGPTTLPEELARRLTAPLRNRKLEEVVRLRTGTEDVALLEGQHVLRSYENLDTALRDTITPAREQRTRRRAPAIEHVRAYLRAQVAEIERTDPLIRSGDDPDAVHDFRVAVRRMRSVLKSTQELFEEDWLKALREELRWVGGELAAARDLDVLLARLGKEAGPEGAPVVKLLETERRRAWKRARAALSGERYLKLLDRLTAAVEAPPVRQADLSLEAVARREFKKLHRAARKLGPKASADQVHRARILAKRARYAAELAVPVARKRAGRFVKAAKRFQDVVGAHQDAVAAADRIRAVVDRTKSMESAFAAGRLVERTTARRSKARRGLPRAWKRLERQGRKAWASS
ncbi:MAG: CHAD domain-containing protein [Gaiellaceae bacterium]